jgi:small-conductance mechanosensitive channel
MSNILTELTNIGGLQFLKSILLIWVGFLLAKFCSNTSRKLIARYATSQQTMLLQKTIYFIILVLFFVTALQQLGFKLSILLGSAGIATAAIAIAAQTSFSNVISGIFLILEKSFQVGDRIKIGDTTGTVTSIDLLSVKVITANNTLIRIPNENIIKSEITNITHFENRRLDISLTVSHKEDIKAVKKILLQIAKQHSLSLKTPKPEISIQDFSGIGVNLHLSVWTAQKNYEVLKDGLLEKIKEIFAENNIQLSLPQKIIHIADINDLIAKIHQNP